MSFAEPKPSLAVASQNATAKIQKKWPVCKTFTKKVAIYFGFNTLFWTKKSGARQTGKNTSLAYSEYVVRGLSVRPLRTGFLHKSLSPQRRLMANRGGGEGQ